MTVPLPQDDVRPGHLPFADWLAGVITYWRVVAWSVFGTFVMAGLAVLIISPRYEAEALFLVNGASGQKSLAGAGGALAGIAGQLGLGGGDASESPAFYKELLESRELLTRLLETKFPDPRTEAPGDSARLLELIKVRQTEPRDKLERAVKKLRKRLTAETNVKTPVVRLYAVLQWPELSAQVDNRAMELVNVFNREQRLTRVRAKRVYLQQRMDSAQGVARDADARHRAFLSGNRKMDFSPSLQLMADQLKRKAETARDDYLSLQKQVDAARLDELNDTPLITVVDSAIPPARALWPRYEWVIAGCIIIGLIIGVTIAGALTVWDAWAARNPASASRLSNAWASSRQEVTRKRNGNREEQSASTP